MTFARGVFIFAFLMLIVGAVGARLIIGPLLFGDVGSPSYAVSARVATATSTPAPTSRPPVERPRPTATPAPTVTQTARPVATETVAPQPTRPVIARPTVGHSAKRTQITVQPTAHVAIKKRSQVHRAPARTPTPSPSATPAASPTPSGTVTLANYWVGSTTGHPGTTIEVGYVIDNQTGVTARVELGASVKASSQLNWATDSVSDPSHDVVAVVPPGISRHVRYFTLSPGLRAGPYDIAWGLRNPSTGSRVALVAAPSALYVQRIVPAP